MLNRIVLIGRLTRDPELKYTPTGVPVAQFGVAVNRFTKNAQGEREVDFFNAVAWRHSAEFISQYGSKGRLVALEGRVQIRNYVDSSGMKRSATEVVADNVQLLDSPRDGSGEVGRPPAGAPAPAGSPPTAEQDDFEDPFAEA